MYKERLVFDKDGYPMFRGFDKTNCYFGHLGFWDYIFFTPYILALTIAYILEGR